MFRRLLAIAGASLALHAAAQTGEPVRIGFLTVDSGPFAFFQPHLSEPMKFAVEQINAQGGVLGRRLELVTQAHAGTPASALTAAQRLVQQGKAPFLVGFNTTSMALALAPRLPAMNAILLDGNTSGDDLTTRQCLPHYFRVSANDSMNVNALRSVLKESGIRTWNVIAPDYAMGHDFDRRFRAVVEELGGTVQTTVFAPQGTTDFGTHIAQLTARPAQGLAVVVVGSDAGTFAKQQKQFGLFQRFKAVVSSHFTNDIILPAQSDTTLGTYSSMSYSPELPGEKNAAFVKAWQQKFQRPPSYIEADSYLTIELLRAAIEKAGTADVAAVRKALAGLKAGTIMGEVEMRAADHQLIRPMAVVQVEPAGEGRARLALRSIQPGASIMPPATLSCD